MQNPYELVEIDESRNRVIIDDNLLDINYKPNYSIDRNWKPSRKIRSYAETNRAVFDIETSGLDPTKDRIYAIGVKLFGHPPEIFKFRSEKQTISSFNSWLKKNTPEILIGHNIFNFDLYFIANRMRILGGFNSLIKISDYESRMTYSSVHGQHINFHQAWIENTELIDTYLLAGAEEKRLNQIESFRLKDLAIRIGGRNERRLELSPEEITDSWNSGDERLEEYLIYDLEDSETLAEYYIPQIYYTQEICPLSLQQISYASPAKIWESILEEAYGGRFAKHPEPDVKRQYDGGFVSVFPGLYKNVAKIDVGSMYPSIQLQYGLCSGKDKNYIFLAILQYLKNQKDSLKHQTKDPNLSKYEILDTKARLNAVKILMNGGYGFFGTDGYSYNCMKSAALVTAYGRKLIQLMIDITIDQGGEIIEVDTDGIYFSSLDPNKIFEKVNELLPDGIKVDLDYGNAEMFVAKKKSYLIRYKGKWSAIGDFRKRHYYPLRKEFPIKYIEKYLASPTEAESYYNELIQLLFKALYPVEELCFKQRIPASAKTLLMIGKPGDIVQYYWTGTSQKKKTPALINSGVFFNQTFYVDEITKIKKSIDNTINKFKDNSDIVEQLTLFD